jgi:putative flippase GtrA
MLSKEPSKGVARVSEIARFGISGLATEFVYFGLLWLSGLWQTMPMWQRATLAYLGSIVVNYALQRSFTFRSQKTHTHSGPRYILVHSVGMAINSGVLGLTVDVLKLPFLPSQVAAIGLVAIWSYIGQKRWAF